MWLARRSALLAHPQVAPGARTEENLRLQPARLADEHPAGAARAEASEVLGLAAGGVLLEADAAPGLGLTHAIKNHILVVVRRRHCNRAVVVREVHHRG